MSGSKVQSLPILRIHEKGQEGSYPNCLDDIKTTLAIAARSDEHKRTSPEYLSLSRKHIPEELLQAHLLVLGKTSFQKPLPRRTSWNPRGTQMVPHVVRRHPYRREYSTIPHIQDTVLKANLAILCSLSDKTREGISPILLVSDGLTP